MNKPAKTIELTCCRCGISFTRLLRIHRKKLAKGFNSWYCDRDDCEKPKVINLCVACGKETNNPKFCNKSCAAKINGSLHPKRKNHRTERICRFCGNSYFRSKDHCAKITCPKCLAAGRTSLAKDTKIGLVMNLPSVKGKHPSWKSAHIRILNRLWNRHMLKSPCTRCGYSHHVELAHIEAITDFPKSATLGEVNNPKNVVPLCRNCHWESHHGFFDIKEYGAMDEIRTRISLFEGEGS